MTKTKKGKMGRLKLAILKLSKSSLEYYLRKEMKNNENMEVQIENSREEAASLEETLIEEQRKNMHLEQKYEAVVEVLNGKERELVYMGLALS